MLLVVLLTGLICTFTFKNDFLQASAAEPGYLDFDNLPETNFSCDGKVIGGYYADTETGCQMFHVCTIGQKGEVSDIKFLCLNGTVFDQETRVCERLDEVDCSKSESFYDLNLELYGNSGAVFGIQPENEEEPANNNNDEEEDEDDKCIDEDDCKTEPQPSKPDVDDEYEEVEEASPDPTTPSTTSTSSTPRPTTTTRPPPPPTQQIPYPTSSPETIAALLALHNAFQESLKEHERPTSPRLPSPFPSPAIPAIKPQTNNVLGKDRPSPSPPRFSTPVSFSTSARPFSFVLNGQPFPANSAANQQPAQISNHHFPAPQSNKQPSFSFNVPKPKPINTFTSTVRTTQVFGHPNFQQSYQHDVVSQEGQDGDRSEYDEEDYHLPQSSTTRPFYNPYHLNQNRFVINQNHEHHAESQGDIKKTPPPSSSSNFLLQQLKLRFNENILPSKFSGSHGFTRAISNHDTKIFSYPEKSPSTSTPPPVSVVLSKSSTSSVVRSVSSKNQSAISIPQPGNSKSQPLLIDLNKPINPTTSKSVTSSISPNITQVASAESDYKGEEYDYLEDELEPDPFYKDVQKLERQKRQVEFLNKYNTSMIMTGHNSDEPTTPLSSRSSSAIMDKKELAAIIKAVKKEKYVPGEKSDLVTYVNKVLVNADIENRDYYLQDVLTINETIKELPFLPKKKSELMYLLMKVVNNVSARQHETYFNVRPPKPPVSNQWTSTSRVTPVHPTLNEGITTEDTKTNPTILSSTPAKERVTTEQVGDITTNISQSDKSATITTRVLSESNLSSRIINAADILIENGLIRRKIVKMTPHNSPQSDTARYHITTDIPNKHQETTKVIPTQPQQALEEIMKILFGEDILDFDDGPLDLNKTENWFRGTTYLVDESFSEKQCSSKGSILYKKIVPNLNLSKTNLSSLNSTHSDARLWLQTEYLESCARLSLGRHLQAEARIILFLVETRYLVDALNINKLKQAKMKKRWSSLIEKESRIRILRLDGESHTFKFIKDMPTRADPIFLINRIQKYINQKLLVKLKMTNT